MIILTNEVFDDYYFILFSYHKPYAIELFSAFFAFHLLVDVVLGSALPLHLLQRKKSK